jgi:hypothetical protein
MPFQLIENHFKNRSESWVRALGGISIHFRPEIYRGVFYKIIVKIWDSRLGDEFRFIFYSIITPPFFTIGFPISPTNPCSGPKTAPLLKIVIHPEFNFFFYYFLLFLFNRSFKIILLISM